MILVETILIAVAVLGMFFSAIASILCALYYFFFILGSIRPERRMHARLLGPFILVVPGILSEEGERARNKFLISVILYIFLFGGLMILHQSPSDEDNDRHHRTPCRVDRTPSC
jgi:hypothetical protein